MSSPQDQMARSIYGVDFADLTRPQRDLVKAVSFSAVYGMTRDEFNREALKIGGSGGKGRDVGEGQTVREREPPTSLGCSLSPPLNYPGG